MTAPRIAFASLIAALLGACTSAADDDSESGEGPSCPAPQCNRTADCDAAACIWLDPGANDCSPPAGGEGGTCPCVMVCDQCLPLAGIGCVDDEACCEGICAVADAVPGEAACVPECSSDADCDGTCVARRCVE